jgi:dTMP kinase
MSAESELLLMLAARAAFVREVVRPTLESGAVMVADRFDLSTFAYQGVGRGLGIEAVKRLNRFATAGLRPDVVLVLDLSAAEGRARQLAQGKERDRIEGEGLAFLDRVRAAYRSLASDDPRAVLIDGSPPPEDVHLRVREALASRFPEPFGARGG